MLLANSVHKTKSWNPPPLKKGGPLNSRKWSCNPYKAGLGIYFQPFIGAPFHPIEKPGTRGPDSTSHGSSSPEPPGQGGGLRSFFEDFGVSRTFFWVAICLVQWKKNKRYMSGAFNLAFIYRRSLNLTMISNHQVTKKPRVDETSGISVALSSHPEKVKSNGWFMTKQNQMNDGTSGDFFGGRAQQFERLCGITSWRFQVSTHLKNITVVKLDSSSPGTVGVKIRTMVETTTYYNLRKGPIIFGSWVLPEYWKNTSGWWT